MLEQSLYPDDAEAEVEDRFSLPNRCLHVYDDANGESLCDPDDERVLRQAMREYADTKYDRVIDLTSVWGADVGILASRVVNWTVSTRDSRLKHRTVQRAVAQAEKSRDMLNGEDS